MLLGDPSLPVCRYQEVTLSREEGARVQDGVGATRSERLTGETWDGQMTGEVVTVLTDKPLSLRRSYKHANTRTLPLRKPAGPPDSAYLQLHIKICTQLLMSCDPLRARSPPHCCVISAGRLPPCPATSSITNFLFSD